MIQFYKVKRSTDALSNKTSRTESDRKEQTYNKAKSVLGLDVAKHASQTAWPTKTGQRSYRAIVNMASGPFILDGRVNYSLVSLGKKPYDL